MGGLSPQITLFDYFVVHLLSAICPPDYILHVCVCVYTMYSGWKGFLFCWGMLELRSSFIVFNFTDAWFACIDYWQLAQYTLSTLPKGMFVFYMKFRANDHKDFCNSFSGHGIFSFTTRISVGHQKRLIIYSSFFINFLAVRSSGLLSTVRGDCLQSAICTVVL